MLDVRPVRELSPRQERIARAIAELLAGQRRPLSRASIARAAGLSPAVVTRELPALLAWPALRVELRDGRPHVFEMVIGPTAAKPSAPA